MRIVIAGGSGLIGRGLSAAWSDLAVRWLCSVALPKKWWGLSPAVRIERWDARTAER